VIVSILPNKVKPGFVIPSEAQRSDESTYFRISWFDKQISLRLLADQNDIVLPIYFDTLTKQS